MSQMLKSSAAVAAATLISRVLGLLREMIFARFMGTSWVASAFLLAFQVPNLFRRLLGEGALTAAFIPEFKYREKTDGEVAMWQSANAVLSGLIMLASAITGLVILGISLALAFREFDERTRLMLDLLRIMFPYMTLVCLAAVCMGMLNARGRFFIPALGAALLNVIMIASVLLLAPRFGTELPNQIYALAFGVLGAGLAQAAFQFPSLLSDGWRFRWVTPWKNESVRIIARRMVPTTLGAAAFQINVLVTQSFAFALGESIVASFQYAVRLMEFPQGVVGASLGTYLLPTLAGLAAEKKYDEFRQTLVTGLSHLLLINLLAAVLLFALAHPIVRLLYEGGMFRTSDTDGVAEALRYLAPGLVAFSTTNILARAFYAVGDTRVPMQISVFCLAVNVVLSIGFSLALHAAGLALANTLTSTANMLLLAYALRRKFPKLDFNPLLLDLRRILVCALPAGIIAFGASVGWEYTVGAGTWITRLGSVAVPSLLATVCYAGMGWWTGFTPLRAILVRFLSRISRTSRPQSASRSE